MWSELVSEHTITWRSLQGVRSLSVFTAPWNLYSCSNVYVHSQPKDVKPKIRERKLGSGINWQGVLKQKGVKQGQRVV